MGQEMGGFKDYGFPAGEFSYADLDRAYGTERNPMVKSELQYKDAYEAKDTYFTPSLCNINQEGEHLTFGDYSEKNASFGVSLAPFIVKGLEEMGVFLAKRGVTSFLPTTMTLPEEMLRQALSTAVSYRAHPPRGGARLLGIHMEGPYLSEEKKGSQNAAYLRTPDPADFRALWESCDGLIKLVDVAPELPGAVSFTKEVSGYCRVSVAHTAADYEKATAVFAAGSTHLTHLYNAMTAFSHRAPGVIGAASENEHVTAELIADGLHVHPSAVRVAYKLFPGRLCLISDALRCLGMPDGTYLLGGQVVFLKNGEVRLPDGTLAGSVTDLFTGMGNAIRFGIPKEEAIRSATSVPARSIGAETVVGAIRENAFADFLICDEALNLREVYIEGERV